MTQRLATRLYASPLRRLIWIGLSLLLLRATWFYFSHDLHLAALIAGAWFAFALSWVVNLFRIPIASLDQGGITLLERLRFGRPNFLRVGPGQLTAVAEQPRGRVALELGAMGERILSLKYLRPGDRVRVVEALRGMVADNGSTRGGHESVQQEKTHAS